MALCFFLALLDPFLYAQDLTLSQDDLRIELRPDGGYHLFIRRKPDISSVLLTETTRDPSFQGINYAYRTEEKNPVNGDEIRLIDGKPIPKDSGIYSLVSSTPQMHPELGWAFHIYIPHVIYYGYEGERQGEVQVGNGTYLNIRAFYYAYADYRGTFRDNPFVLNVLQEPPPAAARANVTYMEETATAFTAIAGKNTVYAKGPHDLSEQIVNIIRNENASNLDIVICLDTTGSMRPHINAVRTQLINLLREIVAQTDSFRIGMVLYRDYREEYLNRVIPFTSDFVIFQRNLNDIRVGHGGDLPEAVFEALYEGATKFKWEAESRIMILVGDAPPHPRPRGKITKRMVDTEVEKQEIKIHAIILPN